MNMKIEITGTSKEIADLVAEIQSRLSDSRPAAPVLLEEFAEKAAEAVTKNDVQLFG